MQSNNDRNDDDGCSTTTCDEETQNERGEFRITEFIQSLDSVGRFELRDAGEIWRTVFGESDNNTSTQDVVRYDGVNDYGVPGSSGYDIAESHVVERHVERRSMVKKPETQTNFVNC